MVEILLVLALIGALSGALGGAWWNGYEGLLLGGSIGVVASVLCWMAIYALSRAHMPQRLDAFADDAFVEAPSERIHSN